MKLTIDNLDGYGAREYTAALDAERPPRVHRRLNRPAEMRAWLVAQDPGFVVPAAGGRVELARNGGQEIFTGYLSAPPEYEYLGWGAPGPVYRYALLAAGDESLLDRKTLPQRLPFVNRGAGDALKQLAEDVMPGGFDTTGVASLAVLPWYPADPQKRWSEHAAALAVRARASYRAHNGALLFASVGAMQHELDEASPHFCPDGLRLRPAQRLVNDVTVVGRIEPRAYVKDYFLGDGYSLRFNLSEVPFTRRSSVLLEEEYKDATLRAQYWSVADPSGAVSVSQGRLRVEGGTGADGQTLVRLAEQIEFGGALILQHGEVSFSAASDGILGGLYNGSVVAGNCVAGFRVTPSGAQSVIAALVNGGLAGTTLTTVAGHRYGLTTRLYASEIYRRDQVFHSSLHPAGSARGGATVAAAVRVVLEAHDLDPNNPASIVAPSTVLYDGLLAAPPEYAAYALVNAAGMHCSIAYSRILRTVETQVRSCLPLGAWRTRLVGALSEGAECHVTGTPELYFFTPQVPAANEKIVVTYRSSGRAAARIQDAASIAAQARPGDDGKRGAVCWLSAPPPRTSTDCENAALALLDDSTRAAWAGEYEAWSDFLPAADVFPGEALAVNVPSRAPAFDAIVREVEIEAADLADDRSRYKLRFANEASEPLAVDLEDARSGEGTESAATTDQVGSLYLDPVSAAEVTDITSTMVTLDTFADPPPGGGFEVRRSDSGWSPDDDRNLIGRFSTRVFTVPRLARVQSYYLRQYDAAAPPRYSRFSTLLHVDYPL